VANGAAAGIAHLLEARSCYNHLAGRLGVALTEAFHQCGYIDIAGDAVELTRSGRAWAEVGGFLKSDSSGGSRDLRLCLDWTERRFHLAGSLPSALLGHLLETGRLRRGHERALLVSRSGKAWFRELGVPV
jgi:hypothetical protein